MSAYNVYYLDDEEDNLVNAIKTKLETNNILKIKSEKPTSFENVLENIVGSLDNYDALFLDLQLDGKQDNGESVMYQAPPLAQMVRMLSTEGKIKDLPIILCSTEEKITATYDRDFTSHDLFDWVFLKNKIDNITSQKIACIIEAYRSVQKQKDFTKILTRDFNQIDGRLLSRFLNEDSSPAHEVVRTIFKDLIQANGALINEFTLAARLGIDIDKSEDWEQILKVFSTAKYGGIFNSCWTRWWADRVIDDFEAITGENLASLDAKERVSLLIDKLQITKIVAFEGLKYSKSKMFWNYCEITKKPLDSYEAFRIDSKNEPKPWQDYNYISMYALLELPNEVKKQGIKVYPFDLERFKIERKKLD